MGARARYCAGGYAAAGGCLTPEAVSFDLLSDIPANAGHLTIMPVSVIDIMAQGKRKNEDHSKTSSRDNYSPFPEEIATLCSEFYLRNAELVFDPFAGWGERGAAVKRAGKKYVGFDTSTVAIEKARNEYGVENILANSMTYPIPEFDGLLTCPPYWNLEKYASESGIDRAKDWGSFLNMYSVIMRRCYLSAKPETVFCVMVGDWRKDRVYYDLEWQTARIFNDLGAEIVDKVIVSRSKVSKIKIMLPQAKRLGYSVRVHENLLVYKKPLVGGVFLGVE
jgi:DNA modification methylase